MYSKYIPYMNGIIRYETQCKSRKKRVKKVPSLKLTGSTWKWAGWKTRPSFWGSGPPGRCELLVSRSFDCFWSCELGIVMFFLGDSSPGDSIRDLFGMVKTWPFQGVKWPPTRGWKGHFESPGSGFFSNMTKSSSKYSIGICFGFNNLSKHPSLQHLSLHSSCSLPRSNRLATWYLYKS